MCKLVQVPFVTDVLIGACAIFDAELKVVHERSGAVVVGMVQVFRIRNARQLCIGAWVSIVKT